MKTQTICAFAAGAFLLTGCSSVYETPRDEVYNKAFMDVFGQIDPQQDWSLVGKKTVTVNASQPIDLKISVYDGDVYRLAASIPGFSGTETFNVDGIKGYDQLIVSDGASSKYVTSGASVSFASTRGVIDIVPPSELVRAADDLTIFPAEEVNSFVNKVPEGQANKGKPGIVSDFHALQLPGTKVTVYPVFWNTCNHMYFGMYTKHSEDGKEYLEEVKLFNTFKSSEDFMYSCDNGNKWDEMLTTDNYHNQSCVPDRNTVTDYRVRGVEFLVPEGVEFGFYVEVWTPKGEYQGKYYSEAKYNNPQQTTASFFRAGDEDTSRTFIGFDDWLGNGNDNDLNDLVVIVDPEPVIVTNEAQEYIIACEDLGADDDFDFNDIVFSVRHTVGEDVAYVTPLAAGGTISAELYYKDELIGGEFHSLFGASATEMVNTGAKVNRSAKTYEIAVDKYFAIYAGEKYGSTQFLHDFTIKLRGADREITAPTAAGTAPQMITVPGTWQWPMERVGIHEAYGSKFNDFVKNYHNTDWYLTPVQGTVTDR